MMTVQSLFSYRKIGGLHHFRIHRVGFSFYWSKSELAQAAEKEASRALKRAALVRKRSQMLAALRGEPAPELPFAPVGRGVPGMGKSAFVTSRGN